MKEEKRSQARTYVGKDHITKISLANGTEIGLLFKKVRFLGLDKIRNDGVLLRKGDGPVRRTWSTMDSSLFDDYEGADINPLAIEAAKQLAATHGLRNVRMILLNCATGRPDAIMNIVLLYGLLHALSAGAKRFGKPIGS